jgi:Gram-negative porin
MKKYLLSFTIFVFLAYYAMPLQAGDKKGIQVYGQLRLSVDNYSSAFGSGKTGTGIKSNSSRIGLKGIMPSVFDGTDIIYLAEMKYGATDEKDAEIEWRESYGGLKGKWGKFRLGRLSMQYKNTLTKIDPWNDNVAQSRGYGGRQGSSAFHSSYVNNAADYISPKFSGFYASAWISKQFDDEENEFHNAGPINKYIGGSVTGLSVHYEEGALFLAGDIIDVNADSISTSTMDNGFGWQVTARYKADAFSVSAFYEDLEELGLGNNLYVNGIYKIDKLRLIATYGQNRNSTQYGMREINSWSVGGKYALGKSTELFGVYDSRDDGVLKYNIISTGLNIKFGY